MYIFKKIFFFNFLPKSFYNLKIFWKNFVQNNNKSQNYLLSWHPILNDKLRFFLICEKFFNKKKIFIQQHGCPIFNVKNFDIHLYETKFDFFLAWGNKKKQKKIIFLPSPQINKINQDYKKKILFISSHFYYFYPRPMSFWSFESSVNTIDLTFKFLKNLSTNLKKKLYYKGSLGQFSEVDLLKKNFNEIKYIDSTPETFLKKKVGLVIINNYSTMFFKCIGSNIPTVMICNDFQDFDLKFRSLIHRLKKKKIIFFNPYKAASFINKNFNKISNWWFEPSRQKVIKDFQVQYAFRHDNWVESWKNAIKKEL